MIAQEVSDELHQFLSAFHPIGAQFPQVALDLTWPSIGTIDLILNSLRRRTTYTHGEEQLVLHCSAYIGAMAYHCLAQSKGVTQVELSIKNSADGNHRDVILEVKEDSLLPTGTIHSINFCQTLRSILKSDGRSLNVIGDFSIKDASMRHLLSNAALGLFMGPTAYSSGPWSTIKFQDIDPFVNRSLSFFALSSAEYYRNRFPSESHGANPSVYLQGLVYPPLISLEPGPAHRAALQLYRYRETQKIPNEEFIHFAYNLMLVPEEHFSITGYVLCSVLPNSHPGIRLFASAHRHLLPALRNTIVDLKRKLFNYQDWVDLYAKGKKDEALAIAESERSLMLLPLINIPPKELSRVASIDLLAALALCDTRAALQELHNLRHRRNNHPALVLQQVYLLLGTQQTNEAHDLLQSARTVITDKQDLSPYWHYLQAVIHRSNEEYDLTLIELQSTLSFNITDPLLLGAAERELARVLFIQGHFTHSVQAAKQSLHSDSFSMLGRLQLVNSLEAAGELIEAKRELFKLATVAISDRRVFQKVLDFGQSQP